MKEREISDSKLLEKTTVLCYLRIDKIKVVYRENHNERTGQSRKSPS